MRLFFSSLSFPCSQRYFSLFNSYCTHLLTSLSKYLLFPALISLDDRRQPPQLLCLGLPLMPPYRLHIPFSSFALTAALSPFDPPIDPCAGPHRRGLLRVVWRVPSFGLSSPMSPKRGEACAKDDQHQSIAFFP